MRKRGHRKYYLVNLNFIQTSKKFSKHNLSCLVLSLTKFQLLGNNPQQFVYLQQCYLHQEDRKSFNVQFEYLRSENGNYDMSVCFFEAKPKHTIHRNIIIIAIRTTNNYYVHLTITFRVIQIKKPYVQQFILYH